MDSGAGKRGDGVRENRSPLFESAPPPRSADHALDRGTAAAASLTFVLRRSVSRAYRGIAGARFQKREDREDADARGQAQQQTMGTVAPESYQGREWSHQVDYLELRDGRNLDNEQHQFCSKETGGL